MRHRTPLDIKYEHRTEYSLLLELDLTKDALRLAEDDNAWYRSAFAWLEQQQWFAEKRHELTAYIEAERKRLEPKK